MSNLSVNTITDASGGSTASINGLTPQASNMAATFNRIINGAMTIDQRNAGATLSLATIATALYAVDRFQAYQDKTGVTGTVGQSTDAPAGFKNSFGVTITTGATSGADDQSFIQHVIEGSNIADLGFGTANAQPITLSFWVKSSITGTNGFGITNSTVGRCYVGSYTVNSANTWEQKTVTIAGDTSGTWLTTNGIGIRIRFNIGSGSNRLGAAGSWGAFYNGPTGSFSTTATSGATFYITGVQLEVGSSGSSFAHENVGDTLQKCQRYFQRIQPDNAYQMLASGFSTSTTNAALFLFYTDKRTVPSVDFTAGSTFAINKGADVAQGVTAIATNAGRIGTTSANVHAASSSLTTGQGCILMASNVAANCFIDISAEL